MSKQQVNITVRNLSVGYKKGKKLIAIKEGINVNAHSGELIALIGSNGIGKSTLLRTLTGFQKALGGEILLNDRKLSSFPIKELARVLSFVSTEAIRVQNLRVWELLAMGRYPYTNLIGTLTEEDNRIIKRAIGQVGLTGYEDRMIDQISDGERQRAMIARTLVQDTPLIILDEPTAFLDIRNKYEIIHLLHDFVKNENKTVLFSTHDLNISTSEVDKVWLMLDDKVLEGAPEDLILAGNFDQMFHSEKVYFNSESGDFMLRKNNLGTYRLTGPDGNILTWTGRALQRIGLICAESNPLVVVSVPSERDNLVWKVEINSEEKLECTSLYELTAVLYERLTKR
ncbi:MAG TPA: ABC transporter ATP-binding protein [Prolixibacteraceae bacterium]|jgi:iron complex transport system ATP-binding protein|nr:ABC transporter ATP-binding protein [Prolixibacteraceae bacterium]